MIGMRKNMIYYHMSIVSLYCRNQIASEELDYKRMYNEQITLMNKMQAIIK